MTHADGGKRYWVNDGHLIDSIMPTGPDQSAVYLASDYARLEQQVEQLQATNQDLMDNADDVSAYKHRAEHAEARCDTAKNVEALLNDTIAGLRKELHEAQTSQHQAGSQEPQPQSSKTEAADSRHRKSQEGDSRAASQGDHDLATLQAHLATATARVKWLEEGIRKFGMNDLCVNDVEAGEYADWLAAEPQE